MQHLYNIMMYYIREKGGRVEEREREKERARDLHQLRVQHLQLWTAGGSSMGKGL